MTKLLHSFWLEKFFLEFEGDTQIGYLYTINKSIIIQKAIVIA
jgi:hypothetical protein